MVKRPPPPKADDFDIGPQFTSTSDLEDFVLQETKGARFTHIEVTDNDEVIALLSNKKVMRFYNRVQGHSISRHNYFNYIVRDSDVDNMEVIGHVQYGDGTEMHCLTEEEGEKVLISFLEFYESPDDETPIMAVCLDMDGGHKEDKVAPGIEIDLMN